MSDMHHYVTAISKIVSTDDEEEVVVRGHRLTDLIREASFVQAVFVLFTGAKPDAAQRRTLDALFTACIDHGLTPAAMLGRAFASYGTSIPAALSAGLLMFGDITGGAGEPLARLMVDELGLVAPLADAPAGTEVIGQAASRIVERCLQADGRVPGFGIPAHRTDPRAPALLAVAMESGAAGRYCRLLVAIEAQLRQKKGRAIPINIDGIVAAVVLDLGFPIECTAAFVMIPRAFSTLVHHLEEKSQGTRWRHVPQEGVTYVGAMPGDP